MSDLYDAELRENRGSVIYETIEEYPVPYYLLARKENRNVSPIATIGPKLGDEETKAYAERSVPRSFNRSNLPLVCT